MDEAKIEFKGTKLYEYLHITEGKQKEVLASTVENTLTLSLGVRGYLTSGKILRNSPLKKKKMFIQHKVFFLRKYGLVEELRTKITAPF